MNIMRITALVILSVLGGAVAGAEESPPSRADLDFFEAKVRPILVNRCFSCHSTAAKKTRGGLALDSRAAVLTGGDSGPAALAGKPAESRLVEMISYKDEKRSMPPTGKLPEREAAILIEWVRRGLPFPEAGKKIERTSVDIVEGKKFWSFQPVRQTAPPAVKDAAWVKKPIDAFLLAEIEKKGLRPSPRADRRVLIRRAYFDLIGLPPAPEEVDAFVKNDAPDAYARLVERLLASPHHGERWGRYWLDLARYCDIPEPWAEVKGAAWLYRDWVIKALNDDLPFDQFVRRQLAADLMPSETKVKRDDLAALGFLGLSPTYWKELKLAPDVIQTVVAEEWEERIHAVGSTFLGLTVACARCHDHKFDPITTRDYYGLAGVFASTRPIDRSLLPPEEDAALAKARARVQQIEKDLAALKTTTAPEKLIMAEALRAEAAAIRKATPHFDAPLVPAVDEASLHVMADGPHKTKLVYKPGEALDVALQIRGSTTNLGPVTPRRFLAVLSAGSPRTFARGSGRLDLADAIVTDAAPLTARVIVNRVWRHHFGRGIVETPSDFGAQGERPTHPELLDDLAARFIANGWSLRWLHREIMLSAAYQQASVLDKGKQTVDPDNRLLWRMHPRRLDVEAWRDAILAVGGTLDGRLGGPSQDLGEAKNLKRTTYGTVKRRELHDLLRLHDFPDPTGHSSHRVPTVTPLQQLFTLNSPFMLQQSAALAKRLRTEAGDTRQRIERAYRLLYGRGPTPGQVRLGEEFLAPETEAAWQEYAQALLASNEFQFVD